MDKKPVQKICLHAKAGEFSQVLDLIKNAKLVKESALNVIIATSNACYHNTEKCELDKIEPLVTTMVSCIQSLEEPHVIVYLQAIFHIIKVLCKKERYEDLTKMDLVINPTFLESHLLRAKETAERTYLAIIRQISQSINCLALAKNKSYNKHILVICKTIMKAQNKLGSSKDLLTLAQMCLNQIHHLEVSNDQLQTFYSMLLEILSSNFGKIKENIDTIQLLLVPIFSTIFSDIIQSRNFEFAALFLDIIQTQIKAKKQEFLDGHLMFKATAALFPINKDHMREDIENSIQLLNTFRINQRKLFYNLVCFLEDPLQQLLTFYWNDGTHLWNQFSHSEVLCIFKFIIEDITSHLMLSPKKCSCGCSIAKNYSGALKIGWPMAALLKCYISQNQDLDKEFFSQAVKVLYFFYGIVKKLKDGKCQKWDSFYSDLAANTYNIAVVLYRSENMAHEAFDLCFLKNSLELEGWQPKLRPVQTNTFVFSALCEIEFKKGNWMAAMELVALHCLLYTGNSNSVFQNYWIRSKLKVKEDSEFQQQTLLSVLYRRSHRVSQIFDVESLLTTEKKITLLTFELNRYKAVWRSKASMMAAFEHLSEIADVPTIIDIILTIYGDGEVQVHANRFSVFQSIIRNLETYLEKNAVDSKVRLALAVLYYYHFKIAFKEAADKNLKEMETTMHVLESAKKDEHFESVPKDANDECDIVSAYSSLTIDRFMDILKSLNTCEVYISAIRNDTFEPNILKNISKLLIQIAFEYRLHCFSIKSLQAFNMSMECAKKISDNETQLFALGFLIESADVQKNFVREMINEGDELVKLLEEDNGNGKYSKTLITYYICKSKAFLYEYPKQSYKAWQKADVLCTANQGKDEFQSLRADLYLILYKLSKSCDFIEGEHLRQPMTLKLHLALDIVIEIVKKNCLLSCELCVLFDTVYEVTKVYNLMRLPRDLRAYSKHSVLLTQKLVLPVRCVSFLVLLAHSDLATCKFDHCNVKLNGIDDIFCFRQSRPLMVPTEKFILDNNLNNMENDIDRCAELIQELALDLPPHTRQYSLASPTLTVEGFKYPEFVQHKKACTCFMCLSLEFQKLLLEKYHLNALLNMYEKEDKVAEEFIIGALALHKMLNQNYDNYRSKASNFISEDLVPRCEDLLLEPYANILYDYSYHMRRKSLKSEALQINTKLVKILRPQKMKYVYLYNDTLLQRLSYIVPNPQEKLTNDELDLRLKNLIVNPVDEPSLLVKTPSGKTSSVTVMLDGISFFSPPKRLKGKQCNLFGVNESVKKSKSTASKRTEEADLFSVRKAKSKKGSSNATPSTPFFGQTETPKIQIFTDDQPSIRTYSRKRACSFKNSSSVDLEIDKNKLKGTKSNNVEFKFDPKHVPVVSDNPRKTRGQLLTQKIKESSAQQGSKTITARFRKNLVDDLLKDKVTIAKSNAKPSVSSTDDGSIIPSSSERKLETAKSKILLDKVKASIKKTQTDKSAIAAKVTIAKSNAESSSSSINDSLIVPCSPERELETAKSKILLNKVKSSIKKAQIVKSTSTAPSSQAKKNLLGEFEDCLTSNSRGNNSKSIGTIRKSTRNRVL